MPKRDDITSLRDGLLRLMMAWLVYEFFGSVDEWTRLLISEVLTLVVKHAKEGVHMMRSKLVWLVSCVRNLGLGAKASSSWATIPAFRHSLLKSP